MTKADAVRLLVDMIAEFEANGCPAPQLNNVIHVLNNLEFAAKLNAETVAKQGAIIRELEARVPRLLLRVTELEQRLIRAANEARYERDGEDVVAADEEYHAQKDLMDGESDDAAAV